MIEEVIKKLMVQNYKIIMAYVRIKILSVELLKLFCDRMPLRLKGRFYKVLAKPIIFTYGSNVGQ